MAEETLQTQYDMDTVLVPEAEVEPEGSDTSTPPEEKELKQGEK